jgi:hypothetical protein
MPRSGAAREHEQHRPRRASVAQPRQRPRTQQLFEPRARSSSSSTSTSHSGWFFTTSLCSSGPWRPTVRERRTRSVPIACITPIGVGTSASSTSSKSTVSSVPMRAPGPNATSRPSCERHAAVRTSRGMAKGACPPRSLNKEMGWPGKTTAGRRTSGRTRRDISGGGRPAIPMRQARGGVGRVHELARGIRHTVDVRGNSR